MAQPSIQTAFHTGEWSPQLNARVDLQKYHTAAALLRNFFVDYRGGAASRMGTRYILQAYKSSTAVRLITFQASFTVGYVMEFGDHYIRFYNNGAPVLEAATSITSAASGPPEVFTDAAHGYMNSDWIFIGGNYYIVAGVTTNTFTLTDLFGVAIATNPFTLPAAARRVYTLASPYAAADLALLKFAQHVNVMILCHPSYSPNILTLISATNWTLNAIVFGTTVGTPTGQSVSTTLSSGTVNYAYVVTAVDSTGQESAPSAFAVLASKTDLRSVAGTNTVTWTAVTGAVSYNVYKSELAYTNAVPVGSQFGFVGNCTSVNFIDSNIAPDFTQTPPVVENPFQGSGVQSVTITVPGSYTTTPPLATFDAAPAGGNTATGSPLMEVLAATLVGGGTNYVVGEIVNFGHGISLVVATVSGPGIGPITAFQPFTFPGSSRGTLLGVGTLPTSISAVSSSGIGGGSSITVTWRVLGVALSSAGAGYTSVPAITFSAGAAAGTVVLLPSTAGNPSVPGFQNQRLGLAAPTINPQEMNFSQPAQYYNYNVTDPALPDNAISISLDSGQLNNIKSMVPMPTGLVVFSDKLAWLLNGGSPAAPIDAINTVANPQAYNGACDVPPIVSNFDILYVQAKGSIVRDLTYNFYTNVYTGTDITTLSSHLFYGFLINEWAYCEEPFKLVWAVRNDGVLLALTFLKEQELVGWTHSDTQGLFKSVASCTEIVSFGAVDALYTVVQRTINEQTLQYIERMAERYFPNGAADAWCVDAGIQYSGAPATTFSGATQLAGATVTGLADGVVIPPFVMPITGTFTLGVAASKVTIGLAFTPQLRTLQIDLSEPTVQGKRKKITAVDVRVDQTLGLSIGKTFSSLVPMKDLVLGNVGTQSNQIVTGLVTGDARTIIDPSWDVQGQYCIQQSFPLPATILGVIPEVVTGDTAK